MLSDSPSAAPLLATAAAALLCWRLWRFTLVPLMNPSAPDELPYWIPFLGHARSFFANYNDAIDRGRKYFNGSDMPFSVSIAGAQLHICSGPDDVAGLYRNTTTITLDHVAQDMYRSIGLTGDAFDKMFALDEHAKHNADMAHPQPPYMMMNEYLRRQVRQGRLFDDLLHKRVVPAADRSLCAIADGNSPSVVAKSDGATTLSLLGLCTHLFLHDTATSFLGHKIWDVNPDMLHSFEIWERTSWKFLFHVPEFMSQDMVQSRDAIINTFVGYLGLPASERSDSVDFVKSVEAMLRDVGLDERDMARCLMLHFWAILGNVYKVAFWTIAHLAYDSSLVDSIRTEVAPAVKAGQLDESYLAEKCPLLDSLLSEVLRLTVASALLRDVIAPTHIRGKTLQPGSKILVPYRQLHRNTSVWGQEPLVLAPARFADDPKLSSSKSYRPFGGGHTLCPGRFMAKRSIGYVVAAMVTRFDLCLDAERTRKLLGGDGKSVNFPRIDSTKPSPGASLPYEGEDVFIVLKKKAVAS